MRLEFLVEETKEQRLSAMRAHFAYRYFSKKNLRKTYIVMGFGLLVVGAMNVARPDFSPALEIPILLFLALFSAAIPPFWRWFMHRQASKAIDEEFARYEDGKVHILYGVDVQKIMLLGQSQPWSRLWKNLFDWHETAAFLLLYLSKDEFLLLPKAQLGTEVLNLVRERLNLVPKRNG